MTPADREEFREYLEERETVLQVNDTASGFIVYQNPRTEGTTFGCIRSRGWAPEYVSGDRSVIHFIPLKEEVLE